MRFLLIEEGWHATIFLAGALADAGHAVTVLTANDGRARCRHRGARWISGPRVDGGEFLAHVDRLVRGGRFDRVLALTEAVMARLWDAPGPWTDRLHPTVDAEQRRLLACKHTLVEHMAARGLAVPAQRRLSADLDLDAAARALGLPLVVKGAVGSGGRMVRIVEDRAALTDAVAAARARGGAWVLQELIAGPTYLVGGLFDRGRPLRLYAAEKLAQHPARTGGAIHLRSTAAPDLLDAGLRVLAELRFTGFASADFMRRGDGRPVLLEVNPRLWGSLAGGASAGVDLFTPFAALLAGAPPAPELRFRAGDECLIFPRYLNAAAYRNLAGVGRALRDLTGPQGRDWLDPVFAVHVLRRLARMRGLMPRL